MKSIVITNDNIQLIAFRLKQFFSRYKATQSYTDWGWYPKHLNKIGIKPEIGTTHTERTITCYALREITKVRVEPNYGIIINIGKASADCLHIGYKIKIAPNQITISGEDKIWTKISFVSYYSPFSNIEKAKAQIDFNEEMDEQYWKDVENDYRNELKEELEHENNDL